MKAKIMIDGASKGNPGRASYAYIIETKRFKIEEFEEIGIATNNQAEYQALISALKRALEMGIDDITVYSDSELLVKQLKGEYKVKSNNLKDLFSEAVSLLKKFKSYQIIHISRELNREADKLANLAFNKGRGAG
ncbi:MAG: ribonuclease HI family protein [Thermosulfidibacteraceae bacterium]|jgi:ribonuclease HI